MAGFPNRKFSKKEKKCLSSVPLIIKATADTVFIKKVPAYEGDCHISSFPPLCQYVVFYLGMLFLLQLRLLPAFSYHR